MLAAFKQRSSLPSSIATGLIGWNSFFCIVALALGYSGSSFVLLLSATIAAVAQVAVLKARFFALRLDRGLAYGFFWGVVSGCLILLFLAIIFSFIKDNFLVWLINAAYIGLAVGGFLSYFYRDDRAIEAKSKTSAAEVDYGRDAHWLEPFIFGAVIYLAVFMAPSFNFSVFLVIIGAMVGVFAAGTSHFSPDSWKASKTFFYGAAALGICFGLGSSFLFRGYAAQIWLPNYLCGAAAGGLTFIVTFLRGRMLARTTHHHFETSTK